MKNRLLTITSAVLCLAAFLPGLHAQINPIYVISPVENQTGGFSPIATFQEMAGTESPEVDLICKIQDMPEGYANCVYLDTVQHTFAANESSDIEFSKAELGWDGEYLIVFWAEDRGNVISDPILVKTFYYTGIAEQPVVTSFDVSVEGKRVHFSLPVACRAKISVYDVTGNLVTVLSDETYSAGSHTIVWSRERMAAGIYFLRLEAGEDKATCKAIKTD